MKLRTLERRLIRDGWSLHHISGSHRHYCRGAQRLVLAAHPGSDLKPGIVETSARRARRLDEALNTTWLHPESREESRQ